MANFRIQRIRSCSQCGEILAQRCDKCLSHPERKPRIVELYDWPEILQTGHCGCLLIQCQRPGCTNKKWRYAKLHNKEGKSESKNFCCSPKCAALVANMSKVAKIEVKCSYCNATKMVWPSILRLRREIFCRRDHHYLWVCQQNFNRRIAKRDKYEKEELLQLLHCPECRTEVECLPKRDTILCPDFICSKGHKFSVRKVQERYMYDGKLKTKKEIALV